MPDFRARKMGTLIGSKKSQFSTNKQILSIQKTSNREYHATTIKTHND